MKVLFVGGTGIISTACVDLALARGFEVTVLNRSLRGRVPGTEQVTTDVGDFAAASAAIGNKSWDVVVDFLAFTPATVAERIRLFRGRTGQYIFISSASAYQKPLSQYLVTESTPLANPWWQYSRDKIACEELLSRVYRDEGFPSVVVRPSLTYGNLVIPLSINSWNKSYTAVDRMRRGLPVIVQGDGLTLWTITHNSDFAKGLIGLLGHQGALGHAFHITSDEALTWNQIYEATAEAAGIRSPRLVHIATDFISACLPDHLGGLQGDKSHCALFDNSKIKRFVPDYVATTRFSDGIKEVIAWYDADPARRQIDHEANAAWDRLIVAYERGLEAALRGFKVVP
jgi:nucleoside-diphosphate-sugar epimerase